MLPRCVLLRLGLAMESYQRYCTQEVLAMPFLLFLLGFVLATSAHAFYTIDDVAGELRKKQDAELGPRGCCCYPERNYSLMSRGTCGEWSDTHNARGVFFSLFPAGYMIVDKETDDAASLACLYRCDYEGVWGERTAVEKRNMKPTLDEAFDMLTRIKDARKSSSSRAPLLLPLYETEDDTGFFDVPKTYSYAHAIAYVKDEGIVSGYPDGTFRPERFINRAEFTKIIVEARFSHEEIEQCDTSEVGLSDVSPHAWYAKYVCLAKEKGIISGYPDGTFKPVAPINFAEAAKVLVTAFGFDVPRETGGYYNEYGTWMEGDYPWYWPYLDVLERKNTIPTTFWWVDEYVSRAQMAEMIERLREGITDRASLAYKNIGPVYGDRYSSTPPAHTDIIRVHTDLSQPLHAPAYLTREIFEMFNEPGGYRIADVPAQKQDGQNICNAFTAGGNAPSMIYAEDEPEFENGIKTLEYWGEVRDGIPENVILTLNTSADYYCIFPYDDMEPNECPEGVTENFDPSCNHARALARVYTIEKRGDDLWIRGAKNDRLLVSYEHFEPSTYDEADCRREYGSDVSADVCPPETLELTRVDTTGTVETKVRPSDGKMIYIYRTPWQPVFRDLRGMSPLIMVKELGEGHVLKGFFGGGHNLGSPGRWRTSYDDCFAKLAWPADSPHEYEFCLKTEAGNLVMASVHELTETLIMWIDEHFVY